MTNLMDVRDLSVSFDGDDGRVCAIDRVNFAIPEGKTVCLVGESGCGKTVTAKALMRILDDHAKIDAGEILYRRHEGAVLDFAGETSKSKVIKELQGNDISMIYQEPMTSLSPFYTIGNQIAEVLRWHRKISKDEARQRSVETLRQVGMPNPEARFDAYSFELSGGMRQRAMIAMALVAEPRLLIADEPTTALDVTTQAIILDLLRTLKDERKLSLLFITHDFGVVADIADHVVIMYLGNVVEQGPVEQILRHPRHPYTKGLLASLPGRGAGRLFTIPGMVPSLLDRPTGCPFQDRCAYVVASCRAQMPPPVEIGPGHTVRCTEMEAQAREAPGTIEVADANQTPIRREIDRSQPPILSIKGVSKHFPIRNGFFNRRTGSVHAVNDVSFDVWEGETVGLVGESGCGKSTLGQTIIGLHTPTAGKITFRTNAQPQDVTDFDAAGLRAYWTYIRMVFQDPSSSLNPRMTVFDIIAEVLRAGKGLRNRKDIEARVHDVLDKVGFDRDVAHRYPHAFSGGQRQRIGIARALAPEPRVIIADEPVSALDVSVQAQIMNLLKGLQAELRLTYIFISHDLSVVAHISDRVAVMYAGRIVELGKATDVLERPGHPYSQALISAVLEPVPGAIRSKNRIRLEGNVPDPANLPTGCPFAPRCRSAVEHCRKHDPELLPTAADGRLLACHFPVQSAPGETT